MTVWSAACEVLDSVESINFYHGHIHPEDVGHLASQIDAKCEMYVDISQFGGMTTTIGNTLIHHRKVTEEWLPNTTWRQKLQRWRKRPVCMCGYVCGDAEMFEYHQAMAINEAIVAYRKELEERSSGKVEELNLLKDRMQEFDRQ